jgi:amidohydrolase
MMDYLAEAENLFDYTRQLRRDFHSYPELGFEEYRTAEIVVNELKKSGLDKIETGIAKTGVVGLLESVEPGPVVLVRFDMDALPIIEENVTEYASRNKGVMHACGHDGHTAVGLTVAKLLARHKDNLTGTVKFVFQPAEEGLGGADEMVKEGILEDPKPDYSLAFHVWNENELNWFGITPGPIMAAAEGFKVTITGKGGHGAAPHQTIDPIYAAAQIVTGLQSIISRNVHPLDSAVVSIGSLQGGSAFNIIPPEIEMLGTIRTFKPEVREVVLKRFREIVVGISSSLGCSANIELLPATHAVSNDVQLTQFVKEIAMRLFPNGIVDQNSVTMGSEDFSFMMQNIPGCFIFVGSANPDKGLDAKHHHPKFDFDETALVYATALITSVISEILTSRQVVL